MEENKSKEKKKRKKKKKIKYVDDGHTVYSMENLTGGRAPEGGGEKLTRKEKWAAIRAALSVWFPKLLLVLGCFALTLLLLYFWLMY